MRKILKRVLICALTAFFFTGISLIRDRYQISEELIRFHVVANSDSEEDQNIKLQVRDAVLQALQSDLEGISDVEKAKEYLQENLPKIRAIANDVLQRTGVDSEAVVTLCKEAFDTRYYDTFTLPAGVYESLRIVIGDGEGKNWWCVSFPTLCVPATTEGFQDAAVGAGFSETLSNTLSDTDAYQVRFYFLDTLGRLQNIFFKE